MFLSLLLVLAVHWDTWIVFLAIWPHGPQCIAETKQTKTTQSQNDWKYQALGARVAHVSTPYQILTYNSLNFQWRNCLNQHRHHNTNIKALANTPVHYNSQHRKRHALPQIEYNSPPLTQNIWQTSFDTTLQYNGPQHETTTKIGSSYLTGFHCSCKDGADIVLHWRAIIFTSTLLQPFRRTCRHPRTTTTTTRPTRTQLN